MTSGKNANDASGETHPKNTIFLMELHTF